MIYTNSQIRTLIDEHIHSERDRDILKARYIDGKRFCELAEIFNLSDRQVQNIVYKADRVLCKYLS